MLANIGVVDRVIRFMVAIVIGALYYAGMIDGTWAIVSLVVAGAFILTSFIAFCPLYLPLGISTLRKKVAKP